jgi:hypothetical protein
MHCTNYYYHTHTHTHTYTYSQVGRLREFPDTRHEPISDAQFLTSSQRIGKNVVNSAYVHPFTDTRTLTSTLQSESKVEVQGRERKTRYVCVYVCAPCMSVYAVLYDECMYENVDTYVNQ